MKRYFILILFTTYGICAMSQVDVMDSTIIRNTWDSWNISGALPTGCDNFYPSQNATQWCESVFVNGRAASFSAEHYRIQSGILPSTIGNLSELIFLILTVNPNLTGNIPPEIGNLTHLERLLIENCGFTGSIPSEIGNLYNLDILNIGNPGLIGMIPQSFQNLYKMRIFNLVNSDLKGELPGYFGLLDTLQQINIVNNHEFSSIIPDSICLSTSISYLYLSNNAFHGTIPQNIGNIPTLVTLDISHNNITGAVPQSLFPPANYNIELTADSNHLTSLPFIPYEYALPPPYYWLNMRIHDIRWNKLQFGDFENTYLNGCSYCIDGPIAPQDSVWSVLDSTVLLNTNVTLNSTVTGQYNTYYWYKNGVLIDSTYNGLLVIPNIQHSDSGVYTCNITNQYITPLLFQGGGGLHLILNRYPISLHVVNSLSVIEVNEENKNLEISPNPASNELLIKFRTPLTESATITIYNMQGKQVKQITTKQNETIINIGELVQGVYGIRVVGNNVNWGERFVKL